jgi:hypothetical protein
MFLLREALYQPVPGLHHLDVVLHSRDEMTMKERFTLHLEDGTFLHQPERAALSYVLNGLCDEGMLALPVCNSVRVQRRSARTYDLEFSPFWSDGTGKTWVMTSEAIHSRGWLIRECLLRFIRQGKTPPVDLQDEDACWHLFTGIVACAQEADSSQAPAGRAQ